jgi:asparagine synthase (glutamine-hydrolysing)
MRRFYRPESLAPFEGVDHASALLDGLDVKHRLERRAPVHQSLYLWGKTILPDYILTLLGDRMEMAHSIEGRRAVPRSSRRRIPESRAGAHEDSRPD